MKLKQNDAPGRLASGQIRGLLIYGADGGAVSALARDALKAYGCDEVTALDGDVVAKDAGLLLDHAQAGGLFASRSAIRLRGTSDKATKALTAFLDLTASNPVIVEAGELTPKSSLRKLFEGSDIAGTVACYEMTEQDAVKAFMEGLKREGVSVQAMDPRHLLGRVPKDTMAVMQEVEKVALFAGGTSSIKLDDLLSLISGGDGDGLDAAVCAATAGDLEGAMRAAVQLRAQETFPVVVLRSLARWLERLHRAQSLVAAGKAPQDAVRSLRPPVFFRYVKDFTQQISFWTLPALEKALARVVEAERVIKFQAVRADVFAEHTLFEIAVMARGLRAKGRVGSR